MVGGKLVRPALDFFLLWPTELQIPKIATIANMDVDADIKREDDDRRRSERRDKDPRRDRSRMFNYFISLMRLQQMFTFFIFPFLSSSSSK